MYSILHHLEVQMVAVREKSLQVVNSEFSELFHLENMI